MNKHRLFFTADGAVRCRSPKINLAIFGVILASFTTNSAALFDISFTNNSGLSNAVICLQGYGQFADGKAAVLQSDGTFSAISNGTTYPYTLPYVDIIDSTIDLKSIPALTGGRIYAFAVPQGSDCKFVTTNGPNFGDIQQPGPTNAGVPYVFFEVTEVEGGNSTFDISAVDSYTMPVTAHVTELAATNSPTNTTIGQTTTSFLPDTINTYLDFMGKLSNNVGGPYKDLVHLYSEIDYPKDSGEILNPHSYLTGDPCPSHPDSSLHTVFDDQLNLLFSRGAGTPPINIWFNGSTTSDAPFQGVTSEVTIPVDSSYPYQLKQQALVFTKKCQQNDSTCSGNPSPETVTIFNPVNAVVYHNPINTTAGKNQQITGTTSNGFNTIKFTPPIPPLNNSPALQEGMFVGGPGASADNRAYITQVDTDPSNSVVSVTVNTAGFNPPNGSNQYCFSKFPNKGWSANFASSGDMVFGGHGVFNVAPPAADPYLANLGYELDAALNRGSANIPIPNPLPTTPVVCSPPGQQSCDFSYAPSYFIDSLLWENVENWYPSPSSQPGTNQYSRFMHSAEINNTPLFTQPTNCSVINANGESMGMAYGFAYDESPHGWLFVGSDFCPYLTNVPAKWDSIIPDSASVSVIFQPWVSPGLGATPPVLGAPQMFNRPKPVSQPNRPFPGLRRHQHMKR